MAYTRRVPVEFNHCDPAGIVFYPRYFEMLNSVVENFFADVAGCSFAQMMAQRQGVPAARLETVFHAPSRLGEVLAFALSVSRLGRASLALRIEAACDGPRLTADLTLVWVEGGRSAPWPDPLRTRIEAFAGETA